jgi:hypothetical protein
MADKLADAENIDQPSIPKARQAVSYGVRRPIKMRGDLVIRKRPVALEQPKNRIGKERPHRPALFPDSRPYTRVEWAFARGHDVASRAIRTH